LEIFVRCATITLTQNVYAIVDSVPNRVSARESQYSITKIRIIEVDLFCDYVHVAANYMTFTKT